MKPPSFKIPFPQRFTLPSSLINYILENADAELLKKLYQTCKWFFIKSRILIIDDLEIDDSEDTIVFNKFSLIMASSHPLLTKLNKIWVTKSFICDINCYRNFYTLVSKLHRCTVARMDLLLPFDLPARLFKVLTQSATVKMLQIDLTLPSGVSLIPIEDILRQVPNATEIM